MTVAATVPTGDADTDLCAVVLRRVIRRRGISQNRGRGRRSAVGRASDTQAAIEGPLAATCRDCFDWLRGKQRPVGGSGRMCSGRSGGHFGSRKTCRRCSLHDLWRSPNLTHLCSDKLSHWMGGGRGCFSFPSRIGLSEVARHGYADAVAPVDRLKQEARGESGLTAARRFHPDAVLGLGHVVEAIIQ